MRWASPDGTPLEKLQIPATGQAWYYSHRLEEAMTAYEMGIPQSQFDRWKRGDKAYALAVRRTKARMQGWENFIAAQESERARKRINGK